MEELFVGKGQYEGSFFDIFGILHDKRQQGKVWHNLIDILFIICRFSQLNRRKAINIIK